jgi:Antirestriction protein (ArdA)
MNMTTLYAQPYDISATGFYFDTLADYEGKAAKNRNSYGQLVEEYELQFIDGADIDAQLFKALNIHQGNFNHFLTVCEEWDSDQMKKVIIAVGECGYDFDLASGDPDDFDVDIYQMDSLKELAEHFVDEGLFGTIPDEIRNYLDYDALARNLGYDYTEATVGGDRLIYRCL